MKSTIIQYNQLYRGITDILKYVNMTNQIYRDISVLNEAIQSASEDSDEFYNGYVSGSYSSSPILYDYTDQIALQFVTVSSDTEPSIESELGRISDILNNCKDRIFNR